MPFPLDSFAFTVLLGCLLGFLPWHSRVRTGWLLAVLEISEVFLVALLAKSISGPGMGVALATMASVAGLHFPPLARARRSPVYYLGRADRPIKVDRTLMLLVGPLLLTAPELLPALALVWLVTFLIFRYGTVSSAVTALCLGPLMWHSTGYDLWGIFGLLTGAFTLYQQVPYLERVSRGREPSFTARAPDPGRGTRPVRRRVAIRRAAFLGRAAVILGVGILLVLLLLNRLVYRGFGPQYAIFRHGNPSFRYVALTFDDGPDPRFTGRILDILRTYDLKATFFLVGRHAEQYPDLTRRIAAEGHEVGNHTNRHRNLFLLPRRQVMTEIDDSARVIAAVTGVRPVVFRPPRGLYDRTLLDVLAEQRCTLVLWSVSSQDWAEVSPGEIRRNVLSRVKGGDILLFHDSGAIVSAQGGDRGNTVSALPRIITELKARGYRFATVSELLAISSLTGRR